jgi:voltage-gated potassium channel
MRVLPSAYIGYRCWIVATPGASPCGRERFAEAMTEPQTPEDASADPTSRAPPANAGSTPGPARLAGAGRRALAIRRVPKPKLSGALDSPVRNLIVGVTFTVCVMIAATAAYVAVGWSFRDALYMVVITVFTVGYDEVRPIDTSMLRAITLCLIVSGCTSIIFLTGALVQFFTQNQINKATGYKRMNKQVDQLTGHVVICGFGRLGSVLAHSLSASSAGFVVVEENEARAAEARAQGCLCIQGDATSEATLHSAGITRAHALASVLSNDALNVFITLSARALNAELMIVARGELASTESKLLQAGADKVVLPTRIGAERIAELLLYQESARFIDGLERSQGVRQALHSFGVELEVITAAPQSPAVGMTVTAIERQAKGAFFVVQINRREGDVFTAPSATTVVGEGDGVVLMGRPNRSATLTALFEPRVRTGARG